MNIEWKYFFEIQADDFFLLHIRRNTVSKTACQTKLTDAVALSDSSSMI